MPSSDDTPQAAGEPSVVDADLQSSPAAPSPAEMERGRRDALWATTGAGAVLASAAPVLLGAGALVVGPLSPILFAVIGGALGFAMSKGVQHMKTPAEEETTSAETDTADEPHK